MDVVVVVHHGVHALRARRADVGAVHVGGDRVRFLGRNVAAGPHVDVGGHVDEVARGGHEGLEARRRGQRLLRLAGRLDGVDVVMVRSGVLRVPLQDRLEDRDDLDGVFSRLSVGRPELPRVQVHQALGIERGRVEIVGIARGELLHGRGIVAAELRPVGGGRIRDVAHRQGLDVRPLVVGRSRRKRKGLFDLGARLLQPVRLRLGVVVVGAERERHAPVRHRRLRIELGSARKGAVRLLVVEAEEEHDALVEVPLGLCARGPDRVPVGAHSGQQLRGFRSRRGRRLRSRDRAETGERNGENDPAHASLQWKRADSKARVRGRK